MINIHRTDISGDGAFRVIEGRVDECSAGYIDDLLGTPLRHSILVRSSNLDGTKPLIIGNNLVNKLFGVEHTVLCVIGLTEDSYMVFIYLVAQLDLDGLFCTKFHLMTNLYVTGFVVT